MLTYIFQVGQLIWVGGGSKPVPPPPWVRFPLSYNQNYFGDNISIQKIKPEGEGAIVRVDFFCVRN